MDHVFVVSACSISISIFTFVCAFCRCNVSKFETDLLQFEIQNEVHAKQKTATNTFSPVFFVGFSFVCVCVFVLIVLVYVSMEN